MGIAEDLELNNLVNSKTLDQLIEIPSDRAEDLLSSLQNLIKIRFIELKVAAMREKGLIGGPVHLGVGQEAIAVGISKFLRKSDYVFSAHRSHAHILSLGTDVRAFFAELLGRKTGLNMGMGGSMHLWDGTNGFHGSVPIVAGTVPIAVGAALAAKFRGTDDIAVSYFGDGAIEEGVVHESFNLSRMLEAPVLLVCENNLFSSHMHISQRQPALSTARFALANKIKYEIVDGNNLLDVENAANSLISYSRKGNGPTFLEAITYRQLGHVDWRSDTDVGLERSSTDLLSWKLRDPISRLAVGLIRLGFCSLNEIDESSKLIESEIETAWNQAIEDPYPEAKDLLKNVYSSENMEH